MLPALRRPLVRLPFAVIPTIDLENILAEYFPLLSGRISVCRSTCCINRDENGPVEDLNECHCKGSSFLVPTLFHCSKSLLGICAQSLNCDLKTRLKERNIDMNNSLFIEMQIYIFSSYRICYKISRYIWC